MQLEIKQKVDVCVCVCVINRRRRGETVNCKREFGAANYGCSKCIVIVY